MKTKEFKRVVSWKEEPNTFFMFFGISLIILSFIFLFYYAESSKFVQSMIEFVLVSSSASLGGAIFIEGKGSGRKVRYVEVKK